jgi:Zn-dependent M28 family amino/carboxypeptidase
VDNLLTPPTPPAPRQRPQATEEHQQRRRQDMMRRRELQSQLAAAIEESGALGFLSRSGRMDGILRGGSSGSRTPGDPAGLPQIMLADEDYSLIYRNVANGVPVSLEFNVENRYNEDDPMAWNTVGEIRGSDLASEVVMLGGHLDSWHMGGGATDNASGSIVMLEAVRILKAIGVRPRRTIRIALWSGEEQGLLGSRAYVRDHEDELDRISAYFNVDNGTGKIRGIWTQMNPYAQPIFEQLLFPFRDLGVVAVRHGNTGGTDHLSFNGVGVPGFNFIQDPIEYSTKTHHTNVDTYDALLLEDLQQAAVVVASTVYHVAMRDEMFPRKPQEGGGS